MSMWEISKTFEFNYGHKVHNQSLEKDLALTENCKCKHLHGHEAKVVVTLSGTRLINGMITDFNNLNWLKQWIDETIDHKFIIDEDDPHLKPMSLFSVNKTPVLLENKETHRIVEWDYKYDFIGEWIEDYYKSFVFVDFVPTSENLAKWIYDIIKIKMGCFLNRQDQFIHIDSVEWWETPKSKSIYRG